MDPIGVIGFIVDNAERLKRALDQVGAQATSPQLSTLRQVRANDEAIDSLTHQVATSLEDLEEIFDGLRAPASSGQPMPAGLEKDLNRMKISMAQSADCLLRMSPVRSKQQTTRIRQLFAKGKQLKIREEVSAELRRVDGDMQGLLQRFTTKWTAAIRLEVAEGSHTLHTQGATTLAGIGELQATLNRMAAAVRHNEQKSDTSIVSQSQAYARYRMIELENQLGNYKASSAISQALAEDVTPWQFDPRLSHGSAQRCLDAAVDRLISTCQLLRDNSSTLAAVFSALLRTASALCACQLLAEALTIMQGAVHLARIVAGQSGSGFARAMLVRLLRKEAGVLRQLDRSEEAADLAREASSLAYELYRLDENNYRADHARCLQLVSSTQAELGESAAALSTCTEAVALVRQMQDGTDSARAQLSSALNSLSGRQSAVFDDRSALLSMQEAVALTRQYFERHPQETHEKLAIHLEQLSVRLRDAGDPSAAMVALEESLGIFRPLYEARPDRHRRGMAGALELLATLQAELGMPLAALDTTQEAVALERTARAANPGQHADDLAYALSYFAEFQFVSGRPLEDVLVAQRECVAIWREVAYRRPSTNLRQLARSLSRLALYQSEASDNAASLTIREAVALQDQTQLRFPRQVQTGNASVSWTAAHLYARVGQAEQAKLYMDKTAAAVQSHAGARTIIEKAVLLRERRFRILDQEQAADDVLSELKALKLQWGVQESVGGGSAPFQSEDALKSK